MPETAEPAAEAATEAATAAHREAAATEAQGWTSSPQHRKTAQRKNAPGTGPGGADAATKLNPAKTVVIFGEGTVRVYIQILLLKCRVGEVGPRGRLRKIRALRRETTRRGRAGLPPLIDPSTARLRARKWIIGAGREDIELGDPVAVLFARQIIDRTHYDLLASIADILQKSRAAGPRMSMARLWALMLATDWPGFNPLAGEAAYGLAASSQRRLAWVLRRLNGTRDLVIALAERRIPPLVERVFRHEATAEDEEMLERLRAALDSISVGPRKSVRR